MAEGAVYDTSVVIDVEDVDLGLYTDRPVVVSAVTVGELAYGIGAGTAPPASCASVGC